MESGPVPIGNLWVACIQGPGQGCCAFGAVLCVSFVCASLCCVLALARRDATPESNKKRRESGRQKEQQDHRPGQKQLAEASSQMTKDGMPRTSLWRDTHPSCHFCFSYGVCMGRGILITFYTLFAAAFSRFFLFIFLVLLQEEAVFFVSFYSSVFLVCSDAS